MNLLQQAGITAQTLSSTQNADSKEKPIHSYVITRKKRLVLVRPHSLNNGRIKIDPEVYTHIFSKIQDQNCIDEKRKYAIFQTPVDAKISDVDIITQLNICNSLLPEENYVNVEFFLNEYHQKRGPLYSPGKEIHLILDYLLIEKEGAKVLHVFFMEIEEDGECHLHIRPLRAWKPGNFGIVRV